MMDKYELIDYVTVQLNKLKVEGVENMQTIVLAVKALITLKDTLKSEEASTAAPETTAEE